MSETKNAPPRVGRWYRVHGVPMRYEGASFGGSDFATEVHVFHADDGADVKIAVSEWSTQRVEQLGTTGQRFAALEERIAALEARLLAPPAGAWTPSPESVAVFTGGYVSPSDVSDETRARLAACHVDHDACSAEQRGSAGRAAQGPCVRGVVDLVTPSADDQHAAERGTSSAGAEVTASEGGDTARADSAIAERLQLAEAAVDNLRARLAEARADGMRASAKVEAMRRGVQEMEAERDAQRHELANMRAELERERVRRCVAEEVLAAKSDPRNEEARKRGLTVGARVRVAGSNVRGTVVEWDEDGDPCIRWSTGGPALPRRAHHVDLDTEATT